MRTFRVRYRQLGGHIHCRVFVAENPSGTFAKLGELVMDERDWVSFRDQIGSGWQLLPEETAQSPAAREAGGTDAAPTVSDGESQTNETEKTNHALE